jgi:hypothetical protein
MQAADLVMQQFLGPPLGGALAGLGLSVAFLGGSSAYLGCAALLGSMGAVATRGNARAASPRATMWSDIGEGLRFLWSHALLRRFAFSGAALNAAFAAVLAALPLYAVRPGPVGLSPTGYGLLMAAAGVGGMVAALSAPRVSRRLGTAWTLRISVFALAVGFGLPVFTTRPALVAAGLSLTGATAFYNIITVSIRQRTVPDHLLGRVSSCYRLFLYGALPIGSALAGLAGQMLGLRAVFGGAALTAALVGLGLLLSDVPVAPRKDAAHVMED